MAENSKDDLREQLAALCHEQWSGWMRYMAAKTDFIVTRLTQDGERWTQLELPTALYERWDRQMSTPYDELPEEEKESDRQEADRFLAILKERGAL